MHFGLPYRFLGFMSLGFHGFMKTSKKFVDYLDFLAYYFIGIFYIKHRKKSHTLEKMNLS